MHNKKLLSIKFDLLNNDIAFSTLFLSTIEELNNIKGLFIDLKFFIFLTSFSNSKLKEGSGYKMSFGLSCPCLISRISLTALLLSLDTYTHDEYLCASLSLL